MIRIALAWLLLALVCQGFGLAVESLWRLMSGSQERFDRWPRFWIGLAFLLLVLLVLNFVVPLTSFVAGAVALISTAGFFNRCSRATCIVAPDFASRPRVNMRGLVSWTLAAATIVLLVMKSATWRWSSVYDTDLYHFSWVRWAKEYAVVPGIANLHCRLGHTYAGLLLAAFVDHGWWDGRSAWVVPGFALGAALLQWLHVIVRETTVPPVARFFALFTLPYLIAQVGLLQPSLYTDDVAHILLLVAGLQLLRYPPKERGAWLLALRAPLFLISAAYAVKALSAVVLLVAVLSALIAWSADERASRPAAIRRAATLLLLPGLFAVSVVARNSIATGWPLYPSPILALPVDWSVPREPIAKGHEYKMQSVEGQYRVLKGWARRPGPHYGKAANQRLSEWLPRWARQNWRGVPRFIAIAGAVCVAAWLTIWPWRRRGGALWGEDVAAILILLMAGASLVFWLLTAPDLRFGLGFFWMWFGAAGALLFSRLPDRAWIRLLAIAAVASLVWWMKPSLKSASSRPWWEIGHSRSLPVQELVLGTNTPFLVYAPVQGDQCGDAPLPCTPYPLKELRMRKAGNLGAGFYLETDD